MAVELLAAGGCGNDNRIALDGAGQGDRDWLAAVGAANVDVTELMILIIAFCIDADDMNDAIDATFKLQWRNISDAGAWTDLSDSGEIKWASASDLIEDNAVVEAEDSGANLNCTGKGWGRRDGLEKEGANGFTRTIAQDAYEDFHWAIDVSGADYANNDQYEFRLTQADDTEIVVGTTKITIYKAGKIDGVSKNKDRTSPVVSVLVTATLSDNGNPAKPIGEVVDQVVSSGVDGTYTLDTGIYSGTKYFLHGYKEDGGGNLADGCIEVTAEDY